MVKNKDICENFVNCRNLKQKTKHLFIEKQENNILILYSYGYHFPLSIKLLDNTILINSNGYSNTTARHKGNLCRALGFNGFKDVEQNKGEDILIFSTSQLKEILEKGFKNKSEIAESKI